jgi:hypothetical protein
MSSEECETLLGHLEGCDACARRLESLSEKDTLVELIRQAHTRADAPARELVAHLGERLRNLRHIAEAKTEPPAGLVAASKLSFACPGCGATTSRSLSLVSTPK